MKPVKSIIKLFFILVPVLAAFFILIDSNAFAQGKEDGLKIVKIVDGDTSTIEKTMNEANVKDFTKQFENVEGKNVQVMITVEDANKEKHVSCQASDKTKGASSMHFNFDLPGEGAGEMDSSIVNSFSKIFMFNDSIGKNFVWNDSVFKSLHDFPKDFNFNFNFNDKGEMNNFDFDINTDDNDNTVIVKKDGSKTIVIHGDKDNAVISQSESGNGKTKTKTKTLIINDDKNKSKKKVVVSTSVVVTDMDGEDNKSSKRNIQDDNSFNFYPNPSDGNFTLDLDLNGKDDAIVRIADMNGKEVYNEKISGNGKISKTIDLGNKSGTFIVTIKQGKRTCNKKIIIE